MEHPNTPGPDETLNDLAWLHPEIYRGIEYGVFEAKTHFTTKQIIHDGAAFSTLVRLHAKNYLITKGLDAIDVEDVNLTGLSLKLDGYQIKVWKAADSNLPVPGQSEPKQAFYQQTLFDGGERPEIIHLAVIWNVKNSTHELSAVWLVCPKNGDEKSAEDYWTVRIPDPALEIPLIISDPTPSSDLPMGPKKSVDEKKKKGNEGQ
jgi:hypothetical protein